MLTRIHVGLITLFCCASAGLAQTAPHTAPPLDTLIAVALRSNPEIRMARYESLAAQQRIDPASTLPDPQLKVAAMNVPTNFTLTSDMMTMAPQVSLMQMLPWWGKLSAAGDVERYGYESSRDKLSRVSDDVVSNLKKVYAEMYRAEKTLDFLKYKKDLLRGVVNVAEQLFAVGQVPQQDVFRATADQTMVESDILMERSNLAALSSRLGALLGKNAPYLIRIDTLALPPLDSLSDLEARLTLHNPELRQIHNRELQAHAGTILARKNAVPDLTLGVAYGYRGALMPDGTKALDMMNVEVGISIPVFFGSRQGANIDEADLMERAANEEYGSATLALSSRLRSVYAEAGAQQEVLPLYTRELIPQYEATFRSSLSSYGVGRTTFAMVIDNLTTLINAKITYAKIQAAYFSTVADIVQLVGNETDSTRGAQ